MDKQIILILKDFINTNQNDELKDYIGHLIYLTNDYRLPYEYIFRQVYIHACLKKNKELVDWLKGEIYEKYFDVIQKSGLRHIFCYGNYLLNKT